MTGEADVVLRLYIAELNKPRIRLPSIVGFAGDAGGVSCWGRVTR